MSYKLNHYAKTANIGFTVSWESVLIELCIGIICCVMAYAGWQSDMALMAYPCIFIAFICFALVVFQVFMYFKEKRRNKAAKNNETET